MRNLADDCVTLSHRYASASWRPWIAVERLNEHLDPERASRDAAVLDAVLGDLLTKNHPQSPLFDKTQVFLAPDEVAPSLKVFEVIHEPQLQDFAHVSQDNLALAREAANDLIRRWDVVDVLNQFTPTDKHVILWDDAREDADRKKFFLNRTQVFRALAPGCSRDHKFAVVYMHYPRDMHAGWGSWGLARRNSKWVVVFRDLWQSLQRGLEREPVTPATPQMVGLTTLCVVRPHPTMPRQRNNKRRSRGVWHSTSTSRRVLLMVCPQARSGFAGSCGHHVGPQAGRCTVGKPPVAPRFVYLCA
jgi:hypothetical protein